MVLLSFLSFGHCHKTFVLEVNEDNLDSPYAEATKMGHFSKQNTALEYNLV